MKKDTWLKITAIDLLMMCFAFSVSIVGQMLGPIGEHYSLNLTQSGWLVSSQSIGGLVMALICILYIDRLNKVRILLMAGVLLSTMLIIIGLSVPVSILFLIFILIGFSGSAVNGLTNSTMSDTTGQKANRHVNLLHMFFSVGAVFTPIVAQFLYVRFSFKGVFFAIGGFALLCQVYAVFSFRKQVIKKPIFEKISIKNRIRDALVVFNKKGMKFMAAIAIMISAWQLSTAYYISSFFTELSGNANYGAAALSLFFLSMLFSRLIYSRFAGKYSKGKVLMVTNLIGAVFWVLMFIVPGVIPKIAMSSATAFIAANNFPVVYSGAFDIAPNNKATGTGLVLLGYYISIFLFVPIIGSLGEAFGLGISLVVAAVPILLTGVLGWRLHKKYIIV